MIKAIFCILFLIPLIAYGQVNEQDFQKKYFDSITKAKEKIIGQKFNIFSGNAISGKKYSEKDFIGKVTFVNFWFKDCEPCIAEFEVLNELNKQFKSNKKFQMVGFTFERISICKAIIKKYKLNFDILPVSESKCSQLNFGSGFPTALIIDNEGKVAFFDSGGPVDAEKIKEKFEKLIIPILYQLL